MNIPIYLFLTFVAVDGSSFPGGRPLRFLASCGRCPCPCPGVGERGWWLPPLRGGRGGGCRRCSVSCLVGRRLFSDPVRTWPASGSMRAAHALSWWREKPTTVKKTQNTLLLSPKKWVCNRFCRQSLWFVFFVFGSRFSVLDFWFSVLGRRYSVSYGRAAAVAGICGRRNSTPQARCGVAAEESSSEGPRREAPPGGPPEAKTWRNCWFFHQDYYKLGAFTLFTTEFALCASPKT